jgi:hypothetical protein
MHVLIADYRFYLETDIAYMLIFRTLLIQLGFKLISTFVMLTCQAYFTARVIPLCL